jgi:Tfp pilus assembly protein PilN
MNKINFINPLPPKKQEELQRWYNQTLYAVGFTLFILTSISLYQCWQMTKIRSLFISEKNTMAQITVENDLKKLQEKETTLAQRIKKIENLETTLKNPTLFLDKLSELIPADVALLNVKNKKKHFELEGQAFSAHAVMAFVQVLSKDKFFKNVHIVSMAQESVSSLKQKFVRFILKGTVET